MYEKTTQHVFGSTVQQQQFTDSDLAGCEVYISTNLTHLIVYCFTVEEWVV